MKAEIPNLSYIHKLSDGDKEFEESMIAILKKELPIEKKKFVESIQQQEYQKSAEIVHKIKHKISILGLERSYEFAISFEEDLKKGNPNGYEKFLQLLQRMEDFLTNL